MSKEKTEALLREVNAIINDMVADNPYVSDLIQRLDNAGVYLYLTADKIEPQKQTPPPVSCAIPDPLVRNGKVIDGAFNAQDVRLLGACGISLGKG
jgi:hypothetical protein